MIDRKLRIFAVGVAFVVILISVTPLGAANGCPATRLDGITVRAGPFTGYVVPKYDAVGGRFSLRVGGMRTETLSSKIPWFVSYDYKVGDSLVVTGRRLGASPRSFRQTLKRHYVGYKSRRWVYPSTIDPPSVGCWKLTFRSGNAAGSLTMLARPAVTP